MTDFQTHPFQAISLTDYSLFESNSLTLSKIFIAKSPNQRHLVENCTFYILRTMFDIIHILFMQYCHIWCSIGHIWWFIWYVKHNRFHLILVLSVYIFFCIPRDCRRVSFVDVFDRRIVRLTIYRKFVSKSCCLFFYHQNHYIALFNQGSTDCWVLKPIGPNRSVNFKIVWSSPVRPFQIDLELVWPV